MNFACDILWSHLWKLNISWKHTNILSTANSAVNFSSQFIYQCNDELKWTAIFSGATEPCLEKTQCCCSVHPKSAILVQLVVDPVFICTIVQLCFFFFSSKLLRLQPCFVTICVGLLLSGVLMPGNPPRATLDPCDGDRVAEERWKSEGKSVQVN